MVCNEIIKAGSLGHGTAVKGYYDVDLVIYSECELTHNTTDVCYKLNLMQLLMPSS